MGKRGEGGVGRSRGGVTPAPFPFLWTQEVPETGEEGGRETAGLFEPPTATFRPETEVVSACSGRCVISREGRERWGGTEEEGFFQFSREGWSIKNPGEA